MDINYIKYLLSEKREFKNFRDLCNHLEVYYNGQTTSRKSLEKNFRQFFEFKKVEGTNKMVVTEVFDRIKPNFKSKGSPLPEYLDPAILINLKSNDYITKAEIARKMKIASDDLIDFYVDGNSWKNIAKWLNNYNEEFCGNEKNLWRERNSKNFKRISFYINKVQNSYKSSIDSAMERLQKMKLITYEEMRVLAIPDNYTKKLKETLIYGGVKALKGKIFPWIYDEIVEKIQVNDYMDWENDLMLILSDYDMIDGLKRKTTDIEEKFFDNITDKLCREKEYTDLRELLAASSWDMSIRRDYFKKFNETLSEYNVKTFKGYYISNVNSDVDVDMNVVAKLNDVFYKQRLKLEEESLKKEFEKEWNKTHFLDNKGRVGYKYDQYNKSFEEFAEKFIKVS